MSDAPTWYDVLGVRRDASADEIRVAWKSQIADLEPGDRRFDALNRAARVLLDADARAAYDLEHPEVEDDDSSPLLEEDAPAPATATGPIQGLTDLDAERRRTRLLRLRSGGQAREGGRSGVPGWLLLGLGLLAAGLVAATTWMWVSGDAGGDDSAAREAQVAAERAVVPVLSYDYQTLEEDQRAAQALMTGSYRRQYDELFAVLEENAPETQTKVTASVVASGIVRASADRVQVLVFVDRPTTNKLSAEPVVYKDQVTLSMQLVDGEWLVDDMLTSPVQG